jgi:ribosome-associated translation inhibitor RaiA
MIRKTLKATSLTLTPAIEQAVDKILIALDHCVDSDDTGALADIEVSKTTNHHKNGDIFRAEVNFRDRHGSVRVESETSDLYTSLTAVKDELMEILRSRKSKRVHFVRRSGLALKNMLKGLPWKKRKM